MTARHPPRLRGFDYVGFYAYFLTLCVPARQPLFLTHKIVDPNRDLLLHCGTKHQFAVDAYSFMPDHLHVLVHAQSPSSDFGRFVTLFKQLSEFDFRSAHRRRLWMPGYYDHLLRDDEWDMVVARYVLENPVVAGLVDRIDDYPFQAWPGFELKELMSLTWPPVDWTPPG